MTKKELVELLENLNVPLSEATPDDSDMEEEIRICYWDYVWDPISASGFEYNTIVTYQISVIADKPRHPKLLELKNKLNDIGLLPRIQHEYITSDRRIHSYFSIDVEENIE